MRLRASWVGTNIGLQLVKSIGRIFNFSFPFAMIICGMVARKLDKKQINKQEMKVSVQYFFMLHYSVLASDYFEQSAQKFRY